MSSKVSTTSFFIVYCENIFKYSHLIYSGLSGVQTPQAPGLVHTRLTGGSSGGCKSEVPSWAVRGLGRVTSCRSHWILSLQGNEAHDITAQRSRGRYIWAVALVSQELLACVAPAHENINAKNESSTTTTTLSQKLLRDRLTCLLWSFMRIFDNCPVEMESSISSGAARGTLYYLYYLRKWSCQWEHQLHFWSKLWDGLNMFVILNDYLAKQESHSFRMLKWEWLHLSVIHPILSFI